jgi:hypothetical protein
MVKARNGNDGPSESGFHFLQDWRRCQQFWAWRYVTGLSPMHESPTLMYGIAIHKALEGWYRAVDRGQPPHERIEVAVRDFRDCMYLFKDQYVKGDWYQDDIAKGLLTLEEYALRYSNEFWKVLRVGGELAIEMSESCSLPSGNRFTGRIDLVVQNPDGKIFIMDHKTTGWALANVTKTLQVSHQANGYLWLWNENHPDLQASAVVFNVLRNYKGSTDFKQIPVYKSERDIERFKQDTDKCLSDIVREVSSPNPHFQMDTDACYKYNRACPFMDLCAGTNYESLVGVEYRILDDVESKLSEEQL